MSVQVKKFMQSPVTSCTPNADVADVRDLMSLKNYSAIPIVTIEDETVKVEGIVTYYDLAGVYDDTVNVRQVMSKDVSTISSGTTAREAAAAMIDQGIHHLVVVENGEMVGMVSSLDFVRLVAEYQPESAGI
jgi:CBS domain-containing protein